MNKYSDRALFAKKNSNWEEGVGAGTPKDKVGEDKGVDANWRLGGVWTFAGEISIGQQACQLGLDMALVSVWHNSSTRQE